MVKDKKIIMSQMKKGNGHGQKERTWPQTKKEDMVMDKIHKGMVTDKKRGCGHRQKEDIITDKTKTWSQTKIGHCHTQKEDMVKDKTRAPLGEAIYAQRNP